MHGTALPVWPDRMGWVMEDVLTLFEEGTARWFRESLGEPTPVQQEAWPFISAGEHVLVSAPTGTGKTLSAFLVFLDQMKRCCQNGELKRELQLVYVSPLKSLAADIRENLKKPLDGIGAAADGNPHRRYAAARTAADDTKAAAYPDYHAGIAVSAADRQNRAEYALVRTGGYSG